MRPISPPLLLPLAAALALAPRPAGAETLKLANGDQLTGEVVRRTAEVVEIDHPTLGRLTIPVAALAPPEPPDAGIFGTGLFVDWSRSVQLGLSGSRGNTDTLDATAGLDFGYEDEERRWKLAAAYFLSRSDRKTTDNNARVTLDRDWLFPGSPWFTFAQGRWDWDRFQDWDQRLSGFGGVGRDLVKGESFTLRSRLGLGATYEFGGDGLAPEALLGLEAIWKLAEGHSLGLHTTFYPDLSDPGQFRNITGGEWKLKLTDDGLGLKLGAENEYDSNVDRDTKRNDLHYYGALVYDF